MEWKELPGLRGFYINKKGEVKNSKGDLVRLRSDTKGYLEFQKTVHVRIHQAVMNAFSDEPPGPLIRHLDGNKLNNSFENLKWGTYKENSQDAIKHGTHPFLYIKRPHGCNKKNSKLSENDILEIRERAQREQLKIIAKDYPVHYSTVCKIARCEDWKHI